jgi:uncharacterized protein (TIGR02217 family)
MDNFHDILFPGGLSSFACRRMEFDNAHITCKSGREVRVARKSNMYKIYNFDQALLSRNEFETFYHFFLARRGIKYSFRFQDMADYQISKQEHNGQDIINNDYALCLYKRYYDELEAYVHPVVLPKSESLVIKVNESPMERGEYQIQGDGKVQFKESALKIGDKITLDLEFDNLVRFANDKFEYYLTKDGAFALKSVEMIEVMP